MKSRAIRAVAFAMGTAALAGVPTSLLANDALYDAPPPEDAVFVRWLDGSDVPASLGVKLSPSEQGQTDFGYFSAARGQGVAPGMHLSVVSDADGKPALVAEPARDVIGKVHLVLLNAAAHDVDLHVADGGPEVLDAVAPLSADMRAVNPVRARLEVSNAESAEIIGQVDLTLRRGQDVTLLVKSDGIQVIEDGFSTGPLLP